MSGLDIDNACSLSANEPVGTTTLEAAACNLGHLDRIATSQDTTSVNRRGRVDPTIAGLNAQAQAVFADAGGVLLGDGVYGVGIEYNNRNQYLIDSGIPYKVRSTVTLPYTTTTAAAIADTNLQPFNEVSNSDLTTLLEQTLGAGSSLYIGDDNGISAVVANGNTVPAGTTHLRVPINGTPGIVAISPVSVGGAITLLTENGCEIDGVATIFSGRIKYKQNFASSIMRTLEQKFGEFISIADFGMTANDNAQNVALRAALLAGVGKRLYFNEGTYLLDSTLAESVKVPSNSHLIFHPNCILKGIPNASTDYRVLWLENASNITIEGGTILGDKGEHLGTTGEGGHSLGIYNCNNIRVYSSTLNDAWGVGLALVEVNDFYGENITCHNGRQNSCAVVSGKNIKFVNPRFTGASGTAPAAGIDIEPNNTGDTITNVQLINPYTADNEGVGINIALGFFTGGGEVVDITIESHTDERSLSAFWIAQLVDSGEGGVDGSINYLNGTSFDAKETGILISNYAAERTPHIFIDSPVIYRPNANNGSLVTQFAGIALERAVAFANTNLMGNIHIKNPYIKDNRGTKLMRQGISITDFKNTGYDNVVIENPKKIEGVQSQSVSDLVRIDRGVVVTDDFNALARNFTVSPPTFGGTSALGLITNEGATSLTGFTLPANQSRDVNNRVSFLNMEPTGLRASPSSTASILPLSQVDGKYIMSVEVGARIDLIRLSNNNWYIEKMIGNWTVEP